MIRRLLVVATLLPLALRGQGTLPKTIAALPNVSMRIWVPSGSVRVETWDRDSIRVTGSPGRGSHFFGGGGPIGAKFGVENNDPNATTLASGALVLTVPRKAHVWIKMTDGTVETVGTAGELEVTTVTGSIAIREGKGVVSVETIDATVQLTSFTGEMRLRSGAGRLTLSGVHGSLTAATVSGEVSLSGESLQDARIETIGGGIVVHGSLAHDATLDLQTHNGPITVAVPRSLVPTLSLTSRGGKVINPLGAGNSSSGHLIAYSFKGAINVSGLAGIEGRKSNTPP